MARAGAALFEAGEAPSSTAGAAPASPYACWSPSWTHFMALNDRLGHPAGDAALVWVARVLQSCARSIDLVARIGGEEFAVVLPESDASHGAAVAERARGAVEAAFEDDPVPLTISFGVVARPTHGLAAATLIRAADRALYEAKAKDRNRIVAPRPWPSPRPRCVSSIEQGPGIAYRPDVIRNRLCAGDPPGRESPRCRRRVPAIAFLFLVAVFLIACAQREEPDTTVSETGATMTRDEVIAAGDAACTQSQRKAKPLVERLINSSDPRERAALLRRLAGAAEPAIQRLATVQPPSDRRQTLDDYVLLGNEQIITIRRAADQLDAGDGSNLGTLLGSVLDKAARMRSLAQRYGFKVCGTELDGS